MFPNQNLSFNKAEKARFSLKKNPNNFFKGRNPKWRHVRTKLSNVNLSPSAHLELNWQQQQCLLRGTKLPVSITRVRLVQVPSSLHTDDVSSATLHSICRRKNKTTRFSLSTFQETVKRCRFVSKYFENLLLEAWFEVWCNLQRASSVKLHPTFTFFDSNFFLDLTFHRPRCQPLAKSPAVIAHQTPRLLPVWLVLLW